MSLQVGGRRNNLIGAIVLGVAIAAGVGLGAVLFWNPAKSSAAVSPSFSTLPASTRSGSAPAPVSGAPAPDFTLPTLDGGEVTLSQFKGQPVLINFWASWCGPCRAETPELERVYEAHKADGFVLLGVNLTSSDSLPEAKAFVKEFKMTYPVLLDNTGKVADDLYRVLGLPLSLFVDRKGVITRVKLGAMTGAELDTFVGEILK